MRALFVPVSRVLVSLPVLAVLSACGDSAATPAADTSLPDATTSDAALADAPDVDAPAPSTLDFDLRAPGPFRVGYRTVSHTYTPAGADAPRTIVLNLWYPTEATTGDHPSYLGLFEDEAALVDAPLAAPVEAAGYPVHVHSHGHLGFGATSAFLMRHFASHGWVAIAPDHTGNTLADNIDPRPLAMYHLRSQDITASLDALASLPPTDPLHGLARTAATVMSGHSFGVHTVWATAGATFDADALSAGCAEGEPLHPCPEADLAVFAAGLRDPRVVAAIPMAGAIRRDLFGPDGHATVAIPLLAMSGSEDPVGADVQFATTPGLPLDWIDIAGACHQTFALGFCDTLEMELGFSIVNTFALAFARRHVLGDTAPGTLNLLGGSDTFSPLVTFTGSRR
jgi:predicted dienelactone hydrolase